MPDITIRDLLEAGVHFGHQTRRWNPKMRRFIFTAKNGIYIIDLNKTLDALKIACRKVEEVIARNQQILFVGTKKQAQEVITEEARRCGQFYVTERWLGGMLTNFQTIRKSIRRLRDIEKMEEDGTFEKLTKKESSHLNKEKGKLDKVLGGIRDMNRLPGLVFVVDCKKERIAIAEANKLEIPVIGIIDTNSDPDPIDFPIAGNDDAIKSIRVIVKQIVNTAVLAHEDHSQQQAATAKAEAEKGGDDKTTATETKRLGLMRRKSDR
ncbi:MAG: 30S ribosomal protein S2 [candidate division Zixibacteria bacterium]|nr:30S ribosomal protein S2 [candidate division Zixibacteria bacterium]